MIDSRIRKTILHGVAVCLAAAGYASGATTPISADRIADELAAAGVRVRADQVEILSGVGSARPDVPLTVLSISNWRRGLKEVRLRCKNSSDCLPFYVILHRANTLEIPPRFSKQAQRTVPGKPNTGASGIAVRAGKGATLVLQNGDMRITLPVTCLQNGRQGERIRVVGSENKRIYQAEVLENGLLRGVL